MVDPERADDANPLVESQVVGDDPLGQLVGCERRERDRGEAEPLHQARAELALCHRQWREGICGGTDPHIGAPQMLRHQARSD